MLIKPQREPGHSPLFQVMLDYQNMENNISELPGLTITRLDVEKTTAKFELVLIFEERARQLNGKLEYRTDLFDTSTIKRMIEHYCVLLEKIIDNPRQQIFDIPFGDAPYACEPNHFPEKTGDPEQFNFV